MTQQELNAALALTRKIERLQAQLLDIHATGGVGSASSNTPVMGGSRVGVAEIAAELSAEIEVLKRQLEIERTIIQRLIDRLPVEDTERKMLLLRYVECRPWKLICTSLGYSERRVYQIHDAAKKIAVDCSSFHL